jgi:hypothetical protein
LGCTRAGGLMLERIEQGAYPFLGGTETAH